MSKNPKVARLADNDRPARGDDTSPGGSSSGVDFRAGKALAEAPGENDGDVSTADPGVRDAFLDFIMAKYYHHDRVEFLREYNAERRKKREGADRG